MTWETSAGVESEIAQLRRGDLNALSALLMRYQNRLYRYLLRSLQEQAFRRRLTCMTQRSGCLYSGSSRY
jgi:hypothetical protein